MHVFGYMWRREENLNYCYSGVIYIILKQGLSLICSLPIRLGRQAGEPQESTYTCVLISGITEARSCHECRSSEASNWHLGACSAPLKHSIPLGLGDSLYLQERYGEGQETLT